MDKWFISRRTIAKQLKEIGFPSANEVANCIADRFQDKEQLSDSEMKIAFFIKNFITIKDEGINSFAIAPAIVSNMENILNTIDFLKEKGFSETDIKNEYSKSNDLFLCKYETISAQYKFLQNHGIEPEKINEIFIDAMQVGENDFFDRCNCVLKYFPDKYIYELGKKFLFYPYYTDPIDCIETLVKEIGKEKARELLDAEEMILYLWKEKYQRDDWTHGQQHKEALEIIEKFKV